MIAKLHSLPKLLDPEIRVKNLREARRWARGQYWAIAHPAMPDPIFLVGCSRSGTTVTYETLAAAPGVRSIGYELPQLWHRLHGPAHNGWHSEAAERDNARPEHREAALRFLYERLGAGLIVDKTCINVLRVPYLHALFPQARFVFIHRDGRSNVSSLMDGWRDGRFALGQFLGPPPEEVAIENGAFREWHFFLPPGWRDYNHASLAEACAHQWITANRLALEAKAEIPEQQWVQIRYEDLLDRPVALFQGVFEQLDLPFTDALQQCCATLAERPTSLVAGAPKRDKWREHNGEAIERILPMISPLMQELGYDPAA